MEKVINLKAIKANHEERKAARAKKKAEETTDKKPGKIAKAVGIAGSYAVVATTAAYTAVQVMKHMQAGELEGLHPEEAPFNADVEEGGTSET